MSENETHSLEFLRHHARRSRRALLVAFVAVIVACGGTAPHVTRVETTRRPQVPAVVETARAVAQVEQVSLLVRGLEVDRVGGYLAAVAAEEAARAAEAAARSARIVTPPANNGAHSDAWWRHIAVCEQGGENDSFFGFFSIMDGSAGGLPWETQVAMANAIIARAGDGAWAASCVAQAYAASPGG